MSHHNHTLLDIARKIGKHAASTVFIDIAAPLPLRVGIRGIVYEWFKDYLTNRRQYVTANGLSSDINSLKCGVPQGSALGPLLFLLHVNDIGNCVPHTPVKLHADDINVFIHGNIADAEICLAKLSKWISHNKLTGSLSIDKSLALVHSV